MEFCGGKITYPEKRHAETARRKLLRRRVRPQYRVALRSYRCPRCGMYHLTKQPIEQRKARQEAWK